MGQEGDALSLAGRCECGVRLDLASEYPDDHLICRGEKRCRQCDQVKPNAAFSRKRAYHLGLCKACRAENKRKRYRSDPKFRRQMMEWNRVSYYKHKLKRLEREAQRYLGAHQEKCEKHKRYYQRHRESIQARQKAYHIANRSLILAKKRQKYQEQKLAKTQRAA